MSKEKYNLYSSDEIDQYIEKSNRRVSRLLWFMFGFLSAAVVIMIIMDTYGR